MISLSILIYGVNDAIWHSTFTAFLEERVSLLDYKDESM
jgi:hypothetical protein